MKSKKEDVLSEVFEAHIISLQKYVGEGYYKRFLEIVKKYPKYFPQEYKYYFTIPKEVHKAYQEEKEMLGKENCEVSGGIFYQLQKARVVRLDNNDYSEVLKESLEKVQKRNEDLKNLWDKHYKKYGIEFKNE
jgi:hypothetical protein